MFSELYDDFGPLGVIFGGLIGLFTLVCVLAVIAFAGTAFYWSCCTHDRATFTVDSKERIAEGDSARYLIFGKEEVFSNSDSILNGKFNSSDLYRDIKPGRRYDCEVIGWRVPLLSWYRNVLDCREVPRR
jgi:hypothetical protein